MITSNADFESENILIKVFNLFIKFILHIKLLDDD